MNRNRLLYGIAVILLLISAWIIASPHLAIRGLRSAARAGEPDEIEKYVDFPVVRENLKADLKAKVAQGMTELEDNPFAGLGLMLGNAMIDNLVEGFVSPSGIASLARGVKPEIDEAGRTTVPPEQTRDYLIHRDGINRFTVSFKDSSSEAPRLVFKREGFRFKLKRITLPNVNAS